MQKPRIAIITFPGTNGDTENLRTFWRNGFDAFVFRWNDSREKLADVDGYFIGAGFSYEDRGRSGMVAARDPLFQFLHEEATKGKVILGNCNGAQVLIESGLIPLGEGLKMSLAKNAIRDLGSGSGSEQWHSPGFLNEWIWITPSCTRNRCATSDWEGTMHIPIAHGEGRFVTNGPDLIAELEKNDQVAFRYCDTSGKASEDPSVTLNGSTGAIAGICNPTGNVVALMPHPERTANGDPYFQSVRKWIERCVMSSSAADFSIRTSATLSPRATRSDTAARIETRNPKSLEIFIDTIIVNNEERTVEAAARRVVPSLRLKQYRYLASSKQKPEEVLKHLSLFNPNKEIAFVRSEGKWLRWESDAKVLRDTKNPLMGTTLLRRDEPDTGATGLGEGSETGICYTCSGVDEQNLCSTELQEIFGNPHASVLERCL